MTDMPNDNDAEAQVLGAAMHAATSVDDCAGLRPEHFYRPQHEHLWRVILRQHLANAPTEPTALLDVLNRDPIRGVDAAYLAGLYTNTISAANAAYYADIIQTKARARRMATAGVRITQIALAADSTGQDLDQAAEDARGELEAADDGASDSLGFLIDRLDSTLEALEKPAQTTPTPWEGLNQIIGGWAPGRLYVIGARPGVGKSVLGVQAAVHMALAGSTTAVASLEMSCQDVDNRIICQITRVPYERIEARALGERDWEKVSAATGRLASMPLAVRDDPSMTTHQIRAWLRALSRRGPLGMVVVDYLQLIEGSSKIPRHEIVAGFSRSMKLLAKELHVPVLALSQLNRNSEARMDKMPSLGDLRESGAVEQDADVVMLLHRNLEREEDKTRLGMVVAKNRHGTTGGLSLDFEGSRMQARDAKWSPHGSVAA